MANSTERSGAAAEILERVLGLHQAKSASGTCERRGRSGSCLCIRHVNRLLNFFGVADYLRACAKQVRKHFFKHHFVEHVNITAANAVRTCALAIAQSKK
uniref:Uncharacterized protein n=1 Tax=Rhipicephalus zambeziensis TaxID=60191 RepID=A0A224Y578_9ACAR